jgi:hypothetical protein
MSVQIGEEGLKELFFVLAEVRLRIRIPIGSGSRRAKMTHKSRKKLINFIFWSVGCSLLRAEGFFCNLDVLYWGLGICKL